ncbi:hypothetical protein K445DRAFT_256763 [Daldinia sp. EC12]|nr:hypothetical protein K445DRAFT_256763 [Daldinia sp. EC12]
MTCPIFFFLYFFPFSLKANKPNNKVLTHHDPLLWRIQTLMHAFFGGGGYVSLFSAILFHPYALCSMSLMVLFRQPSYPSVYSYHFHFCTF